MSVEQKEFFEAGRQAERDRMGKIRKFAEEQRQFDIELGAKQERERICQEILDIDLEKDYSDDLVLAVRAIIARAAVAERKKIIERLSGLAYFDEDGNEMISEFKNDIIALI
jgi:hypothetical protein